MYSRVHVVIGKMSPNWKLSRPLSKLVPHWSQLPGDTQSVWKQQNTRGIGYVPDTSPQTRSVHHPRHDKTMTNTFWKTWPPPNLITDWWLSRCCQFQNIIDSDSRVCHWRLYGLLSWNVSWLTIVRSSFLVSVLVLYHQQTRTVLLSRTLRQQTRVVPPPQKKPVPVKFLGLSLSTKSPFLSWVWVPRIHDSLDSNSVRSRWLILEMLCGSRQRPA
jgi:hypothetical protein